MNRLKEADYYFTKSIELKKSTGRERLNRDWSDSYTNLGVVFKERGLISKAERYYALADSIDPTNTFSHEKNE
jgi:tetratricopeptide (TPR) repeat protein